MTSQDASHETKPTGMASSDDHAGASDQCARQELLSDVPLPKRPKHIAITCRTLPD